MFKCIYLSAPGHIEERVHLEQRPSVSQRKHLGWLSANIPQDHALWFLCQMQFAPGLTTKKQRGYTYTC